MHDDSGPKPFFSGGTEDPAVSHGEGVTGPGSHVGSFKLLGILGEGGYGIVYLAAQETPIRRRVALKVIKPGMDSRQVIARFEAEKQALALLDHPNIAHVYDAGTTPEGRPYFAMEFVEGTPITGYCDREKLTIKERLQLFLQICHAIQHAHQKGIIHRDLKPSNLLVTAQNGLPVVKVIDFGIAKALGEPLTEQTFYTEQGQFIGTPDYMSPEQAEMGTKGVDTRSDVYSLGVVLYELLTGVLPFDPKSLRAGGVEHIRAVIREQEPRTPSTRLTDQGDELTKIAERRRTDPQTLTKALGRELEWIPLKAMRKEASRRYQSVSELAEDIENYMHGSPLLAGPESAVYRARKFVQRHAGAVGAVIALLLVLTAGLLISTAMYSRAEKAREKETRERTRAEQAEGRANERAEAYRRAAYRSRIALAEAKYAAGYAGSVREILKECPPDLRGWEWYYLWHISDQASVSLAGHTGYVLAVAISPDGTRIASASADRTAKIWNADTGKEVMTLRGHNYWVQSVAFSRDGEHIITGGTDSTVILWNAHTGEPQVKVAEANAVDVRSVAVNHNGGCIAWGALVPEIKVWDIAGEAEPAVFRGHGSNVCSLAFSQDGTRLLSGSLDTTVKVWNVQTGSCVATCRGHTGEVTCAVFSPDERRIASSSRDGTIRIWDANTANELKVLHGRSDDILSVSVSPDGKYIASGNADCTISLWDVAGGAEVRVLRGHDHEVSCVRFLPGGKRLVSASGDGLIKVWDADVERKASILRGHKGWVSSLVFSPDGKSLVSACSDQTVKIWDMKTQAEVGVPGEHSLAGFSASFSPDGRCLLSSDWSGMIHLYDVATWREIRTFRGHEGRVFRTAFSPDATKIVSAGEDKTARVWNATTGEEMTTCRGHESLVYSACFTPDGDHILTSSNDGTLRIWDAATGGHLRTLQGRGKPLWCLALSPDGRWVAAGDGEWYDTGDILLWDVATGEQLADFPSRLGPVWSIAFSLDGRRLFSGHESRSVRVWDIETREELLTIRIPEGRTTSIAFQPDGKTLAVGTIGAIRLITVATPGEIP